MCELGCEPKFCLTAKICSTIIPCCFLFFSKISQYRYDYEVKNKKEERKEEKNEEGRVKEGVSSLSIFHVFP